MSSLRGLLATGLPMYFALVLFLVPLIGHAEKKTAPAAVAIIIDDLGNKLSWGKRALELPGPIALSFLPHAPHTSVLAKKAKASGKEVMLHLPMQSDSGQKLGLGGLKMHMTKEQMQATTVAALDSVPYVSGLNNHMGSLLTRHPGAMAWVMETVKDYGELFFVDSRTTGRTVAGRVAFEKGVRTARRDVFLDNVRKKSVVRQQFRRLLKLAKKQGYAIGIGHPYPETIKVLKHELAKLKSKNVRLISVSELVQLQLADGRLRTSVSTAQKVVKNNKRKEHVQ